MPFFYAIIIQIFLKSFQKHYAAIDDEPTHARWYSAIGATVNNGGEGFFAGPTTSSGHINVKKVELFLNTASGKSNIQN